MKAKFVLIAIALFCLEACKKTSKTETGFVTAGKLRVYFESQGEGPSVLLLHAGLQDHTMWESQVKVLLEKYRVITIDMPGQGKTSGNDTTILIADVILSVMDSLQIKKTSLVGLSYGAASATDMVLAYPDRVNKVVLVSPGLTGAENVIKTDSVSLKYFAMLDTAFKKKDDPQTAEVFAQAWCDGPFRKPEQVNKAVRKYILTTTLDNLRSHKTDSWGNFSKATAAQRLGEVKKPVMIISGDQDIPFILEVSHLLHKSIKESKEVKIAGVAHMLNMEAVDEFNKALIEFLND